MRKTSLGFNVHNKPSETNDEAVDVDSFLIDNFELADRLISRLQTIQASNNTQVNQKIDDLTALVQSMQVTTHRINVTTDIKENTEYTLPCQYIVGSGDIEIFCNNELMIRAVDNSWGNFAEVGADKSISNEVKFGQTIEAGSVLIVKKTGVIANE